MWKKLLVSFIALIAVGSFGLTLFNGYVDAAGMIGNTPTNGVASTLKVGDRVHLGVMSDDVFIVLGRKNGELYLLKEHTLSNTTTDYTDAEKQAKAFVNVGNFGEVGTAHFSLYGSNLISKTTLNDLSLISNDKINTKVSGTSDDWWLGDGDKSSNRADFATSDNRLDADSGIMKANNPGGVVLNDPNGGTCGTPISAGEIGVKPITTYDDRAEKNKYVSSAKIKFNTSGAAGMSVYIWKKNSATPANPCGGTATVENWPLEVAAGNRSFNYSMDGSGKKSYTGIAGFISAVVLNWNWYPTPQINASGNFFLANSSLNNGNNVNFTQGQCYPGNFDSPTLHVNGNDAENTFRFYKLGTRSFSSSASISGTPTVTTNYCTATNQAGSALVRPYVKLKESDIIMRNNAQRSYVPSNIVKGSIPRSDNTGDYLTLESPSLTVGLDGTANGVYNNTYSIEKTSSGTVINLPLSFGSSPIEGNRYVSAEAVDVNGNVVYGVLKAVGSGNTENVALDFSNLLKSNENSFKITLYLEDSGRGNSAYRSQGTEITVMMKEPQNIRFHANTPSSATYGQNLKVEAELYDFDLDTNNQIKQANTKLIFQVVSGEARIVNWDYDFSTGKAWAIIEPLTGTGYFDVTISKAGDNLFFPAKGLPSHTIRFQLNRAELKLVPEPINATVGDRMTDLMPVVASGTLVNGDVIPTALYPHLEPELPAYPAHPSSDGHFITDPGRWKQLFPQLSAVSSDPDVAKFLEKYDVDITEDYLADPKYIFYADPNGIPDSWIIITPSAPNGNNGWYITDVTLRPSDAAKAFGYYEIALVENGVTGTFDSEVRLSDDTVNIRPTVKLKKPDPSAGVSGEISNNKQLSTRIKIDQTKPDPVNINVPSGWASPSKTITIQPFDDTSGIDNVKAYYMEPLTNTKKVMAVTDLGNGTYTFDAIKNDTYTIEVTDKAGNVTTTTRVVTEVETPGSIKAELSGASNGSNRDIAVTTVAPTSGIDYLEVYYRHDGTEPYQHVTGLNPGLSSQMYAAQQNGDYKFVMTAGSGDTYEAEVTVTDITQPVPVLAIKATNLGTYTDYHSNTWVNQDVRINLSNINSDFTQPITYQYRKVSDTTWTTLSGAALDVQTSTWLSEEYLFRGVSDNAESQPVSIIVKIDKEKPVPPLMDHPERLDDDYAFTDSAEITGHVIPKNSGIGQIWEYSLDGGITWTVAVNDKIDIAALGDYTLQVRTRDDAGNVSDIDTYPVHIIKKAVQTIEFDVVPSPVVYGTNVTITAKLTSDLSKQSNQPLLFSIPTTSANKMQILSQSYDPTTGIATALLHPLNGDVSFEIEINKDQDPFADAAVPKLITVPLQRAPLTVHPQIIYGAIVGDPMPVLSSVGNGLVNGDTIPAKLSVVLNPLAGTSDPYPTDTGNTGDPITHEGTWSMTYPNNILLDPALDDFVNKYYNVTLEDYNTNTDYVFTTKDTGVPLTYVIVSPNPNGDGWNHTDVTLSLSADAQAAGYTSLALIENGAETKYGATILLDQETSGMIPVVVLKKPGETSSNLSLRNVKIDKTKPNAAITIDQEHDWTKAGKKVTITVSDALSGVKELCITDEAGNAVSLTKEQANTYSFVADNGKYHLTVMDVADNQFETDITVARIDKTVPTISATLGVLSSDKTGHDIDVVATVGDSGVKSFSVYYKKNATDPYPTTPSEALNPSNLTCTYLAKKNGFYMFEIVNGVGERASAQVEVTDVIAELPVVAIKAEQDDGSNTPYTSGTWVNKNINITLSNTNSLVTEPITYEYRKVGDSTWTKLSGNTVKISESAWQNEDYEFRGVISDGTGAPSSINIRIDKEKPDEPIIANAGDFTKDNAFAAPLTINGSVTPKASGINQAIWVSKDNGNTWEEMIGNSYTLTTPDDYSLVFKTVDEAGNESDEFTLNDVIVNEGKPAITIKLNNNPLKNIVNNLTFGYLFKDHIDVDIEVNWYGMANGDVYYILDDSAIPSVPTDADPRWVKGDHTSIDPDRKTMIYAKAVNAAGEMVMTSSTYFVIADQTPPKITFDKTYSNWISDNTLTATIADNMTGVDVGKTTAVIDHSGQGKTEVKGNKVNFTSLADGNYDITVKAFDYSGNQADETITVKIDTAAPVIGGVKDKDVYYLSHKITVEDSLSGVAMAQIAKDGGSNQTFSDELEVSAPGKYVVTVKDHAGNAATLSFEMKPIPDPTVDIDCSKESIAIFNRIQKEYADTKDQRNEAEQTAIEKWISDARVIINTCSIDIDDDGCDDLHIQLPDDKGNMIIINDDKNGDGIPDYNIDSDGDGKPDLNIDTDSDGIPDINIAFIKEWKPSQCVEINGVKYSSGLNVKAAINIDLDGDQIPDLNIDTEGKGKPTMNVDTDDDGKANLNTGIVKEWHPNTMVDYNGNDNPDYDTDTELKGLCNIDTDGDGLPDLNIDLDGDGLPDLNINTDGKLDKPQINIDGDGDGKPDINVDTDGDGKPDENLMEISEWKPNHNVNAPFPYDTMKIEWRKDSDNNKKEEPDDEVKGSYYPNSSGGSTLGENMGGALTGDATNIMIYLGWGCMSCGVLCLLLFKHHRTDE